MSEEPGAECPECGADAERRLSGGAGLLFKGSGFYITDYRNDSYKKDASSDTAGGSESKSSDSKGGSEKKESPPKPDTKSSSTKAD